MQHAHTFLVWACYLMGQILHVLLDSTDTVQDKANVINSYKVYFSKYFAVIIARFFILSCLFPFVWDNPSAFDIQGIMHTAATQIGASGVIGYFCDSFADKGLALFGIKQRLPSLPAPAGGQP